MYFYLALIDLLVSSALILYTASSVCWVESQATEHGFILFILFHSHKHTISPVSPLQTVHPVLPPPGTVCASGCWGTSWCDEWLWPRSPCSLASSCPTLLTQGREQGGKGCRFFSAQDPLQCGCDLQRETCWTCWGNTSKTQLVKGSEKPAKAPENTQCGVPVAVMSSSDKYSHLCVLLMIMQIIFTTHLVF